MEGLDGTATDRRYPRSPAHSSDKQGLSWSEPLRSVSLLHWFSSYGTRGTPLLEFLEYDREGCVNSNYSPFEQKLAVAPKHGMHGAFRPGAGAMLSALLPNADKEKANA